MYQLNETALVQNFPSKIAGLPDFYYRCRKCDSNLNANTPANRYQIQKRIQKTVRVYASLYTANLAPFSVYEKPTEKTQNVCWNQMSDRRFPSYQPNIVPTGFYHSLNNKHHSVTSSRPGGQNPGGYGVDIKHNSYDRYLNRLKGKGPLRRGKVSPLLEKQNIKFNRAYPIYGGKVMKTSIVTGCNCPVKDYNRKDDMGIYNNPLYFPNPIQTKEDLIGRRVIVLYKKNQYKNGTINSLTETGVMIKWEDETLSEVQWSDIKFYSKCIETPCSTDNESSVVDWENIDFLNYLGMEKDNIF